MSGLLNGVLVPGAAQMACVPMARWRPDEALAAIERHDVTCREGVDLADLLKEEEGAIAHRRRPPGCRRAAGRASLRSASAPLPTGRGATSPGTGMIAAALKRMVSTQKMEMSLYFNVTPGTRA
ncbi:MAG: hypothetical protein GX880_06810 [Methanomicrobiales archaeon]|nr:hypothetical protein [Methanomicrobiales archaeon]